MENFTPILNEFPSISLSEMDNVKLMNRTDTKFVFPAVQLNEILSELKRDYTILEINGSRISAYESLYFDTPSFDLYLNHHRGKLNRYKVRYRKYVESNLHYFEVKFKSNKGRTIKNRIKETAVNYAIQNEAEQFLAKKSNLKAHELEAKFWVNYSRITLVNKNYPERVTLDLNLTFKNETTNKTYSSIVIAEVKQDKLSNTLFMKLMKQKHIRTGSISKYCFGVINLFNTLKHNNFKPFLNNLNKIQYAATTSC